MTTDRIFANKYEIQSILGKGAFGHVFLARDIKNNQKVAIKTDQNAKTVKHETKMIQYLYSKGIRKIPKIYCYHTIDTFAYLAMELYEYSLYDLAPRLQDISLDDRRSYIHQIIRQILDIFRDVHQHFVVHRDIKPHNFMFKQNANLYIIDFGMSTFYMDEQGNHCPNETQHSLIGTPKYASIHLHKGNTYSRRDDLISLGYMAIFLETGKTDWYHPPIIQNKENIGQYTQDPIVKQYLYDQIQVEYAENPKYEL